MDEKGSGFIPDEVNELALLVQLLETELIDTVFKIEKMQNELEELFANRRKLYYKLRLPDIKVPFYRVEDLGKQTEVTIRKEIRIHERTVKVEVMKEELKNPPGSQPVTRPIERIGPPDPNKVDNTINSDGTINQDYLEASLFDHNRDFKIAFDKS